MDACIFEKVWNKTESEFDTEEKELKINELKRKYESQFDASSDKVIELKKAQSELTCDHFKKFDIFKYRENRQAILDYEDNKKKIAVEYLEFFGKALERTI